MNSRVPWGIPWQETDKKILSARNLLSVSFRSFSWGGGPISYPSSTINGGDVVKQSEISKESLSKTSPDLRQPIPR